jgi:vacuolar-type H+-ATPase subunit H
MGFKYSKSWTKNQIIQEAVEKCSSMFEEIKKHKNNSEVLQDLLEERNEEIEFLRETIIDLQGQVRESRIENSSYMVLLLKLYDKNN